MGKGGTITLLANGKRIAQGRMEKTKAIKPWARGRTSARTPARRRSYSPPFEFTGKLGRATVELK